MHTHRPHPLSCGGQSTRLWWAWQPNPHPNATASLPCAPSRCPNQTIFAPKLPLTPPPPPQVDFKSTDPHPTPTLRPFLNPFPTPHPPPPPQKIAYNFIAMTISRLYRRTWLYSPGWTIWPGSPVSSLIAYYERIRGARFSPVWNDRAHAEGSTLHTDAHFGPHFSSEQQKLKIKKMYGILVNIQSILNDLIDIYTNCIYGTRDLCHRQTIQHRCNIWGPPSWAISS